MAVKEIHVPELGDFKDVEIIEILVSEGDEINAEDSLITVESDKASMEIPSSDAGIVQSLKVTLGQKVSEGDVILLLDVVEQSDSVTEDKPVKEATPTPEPTKQQAPSPAPVAQTSTEKSSTAATQRSTSPTKQIDEVSFSRAYASPSVRKFARELGVDLGKVSGSGRKGRIQHEDIKGFVKTALQQQESTAHTVTSSGSGSVLGVEPMPEIDFSQWGEIEEVALTKINQLTGKFMHRNWVTVPHVTQFDEADITEMEAFRKQMNAEVKEGESKITPVAFLLKASAAALQAYPRFNSALHPSGKKLIQKHYYHIGVAVDTADGLVVPVIRDVDQKSLKQLSHELRELAGRARKKQLKPDEMQGGCFTLSSLGGIGGTKFTPIVNAPEVAILGISRSKMQPVWNGSEFMPRLMLPLSLSYDHRVIDGADGARFTTYLSQMLSDIRRLLL